jgi:hypothetical protein
VRPRLTVTRNLVLALVLALGLAAAGLVAPTAARADDPVSPTVVIEPAPDRTPESVWVDVSRLQAGSPVVVDWGDGWQTTVSTDCPAPQALRGDRACAARVRHSYDRDGQYQVAALWGGGTLATATVQARRSAPPGIRAWRTMMLRDINGLRAAAGVPPLRRCFRLTKSAQQYASTMAHSDHYGHVGPDGSNVLQREAAAGYKAALAGENIGAGQRSVAEIMNGWTSSAAHYGAMVNPAFTHVGFGYGTGFNSTYPTYWVQHFGSGGTCA